MIEPGTIAKKPHGKRTFFIFLFTLMIALALLVCSYVNVLMYNKVRHHQDYLGQDLLSGGDQEEGVTVTAGPRGSTWTKIFDLEGAGITEPNFQAYTYDFTVSNHTKDAVSDFSFKLVFQNEDVFLSSAWNGALEIHQHVNGTEQIETIPDLRDYKPDDYKLDFETFDGETLVAMKAGDYIIYHPSTSMNAVEMPIKPNEATTPGIILYVRIGESLDNASLELDYSFHRLISSEPLFWIAMAGLAAWLVALLVYAIISAQIRKYTERHERDNVIISESIETFTGFIDAKDPYTNGHSKRVAMYTKQIASEMGYSGEVLDRIYYIALLHDCGKIAIPDNILRKPGKLTDEEFHVIQSHTVRGGEILSSFKSLEKVGEGALYHHERYDGKGYPEGRAGEDIPLIARMICVADSFDAMNSNRVYRKKLTKEHIVNEIEVNKGRQFDPRIADVMLELLRTKKIVMEDI